METKDSPLSKLHSKILNRCWKQSGFRSLVVFLLAALVACHASGQVQQVSDSDEISELSQWIENLDSPSFAVRQEATNRLGAMGDSIVSQLETALEHERDLEVRSRLISLLTELRHVRLKRQLNEFRADPDVQNDHGLTAWKPLTERVGATRVAKLMLIEMYEAQPNLMRFIGGPSEQLLEAMTKYAVRNSDQRSRRSPGHATSLLLVSVVTKERIPDEVQLQIVQSVYNQDFLLRLSDPRWQTENRKLVGAWLLTLSRELSREGLRLAVQFDLPEGIELARSFVAIPRQDPIAFLDAMRVFARHGTEQDLTLLEPLLDRDDILIETRMPSQRRAGSNQDFESVPLWDEGEVLQVQKRDAALAACVLIRKLEPKDFFDNFKVEKGWEFRFTDIGFPFSQQEKRDTALKRWKESAPKSEPATKSPASRS